MTLAQDIGLRIKAARQRTNYTQEDIGKVLGIGRAGYSNIENGRVLITVEHLMKLPEVLNEPVSYFLGVDDNKNLGLESTEGLVDLYAAYREHLQTVIDRIDTAGEHFARKLNQLSPKNQKRVFDLVDTLYLEELSQSISWLNADEREQILEDLKNGRRG